MDTAISSEMMLFEKMKDYRLPKKNTDKVIGLLECLSRIHMIAKYEDKQKVIDELHNQRNYRISGWLENWSLIDIYAKIYGIRHIKEAIISMFKQAQAMYDKHMALDLFDRVIFAYHNLELYDEIEFIKPELITYAKKHHEIKIVNALEKEYFSRKIKRDPRLKEFTELKIGILVERNDKCAIVEIINELTSFNPMKNEYYTECLVILNGLWEVLRKAPIEILLKLGRIDIPNGFRSVEEAATIVSILELCRRKGLEI